MMVPTLLAVDCFPVAEGGKSESWSADDPESVWLLAGICVLDITPGPMPRPALSQTGHHRRTALGADNQCCSDPSSSLRTHPARPSFSASVRSTTKGDALHPSSDAHPMEVIMATRAQAYG